MIEQHYTDEALLSLLDTCGSDTLLGDPHLAACATCADALESYRDLAGLMCEKEVWDEEDEVMESAPVPETLSRIRAFADAAAREDAEAVDLVNELLDMPAEWWAEEVRHDERYHTAGVVRRLVAVAYEVVDSVPADALRLSEIAIDVTEALQDRYETATVDRLRGNALREHAYALFYMNRNDEALRDTEEAREIFGKLSVSDAETARLDVVVGLIETRLERFDLALNAARRAGNVFKNFGLRSRLRAARRVEAMILNDTGDYRAALQRYREMEAETADSNPGEVAGISNNIGNCHRELREFDRAMSRYAVAQSIYDDLGNRADGARVRWNIAQTLAATGNVREAEKRYLATRAEFRQLSMNGEAAVVTLNLAEIALAESRFAQAETYCREVIAHFSAANAAYTSNALAALGYLREAVEQRKADAAVAEAVRRYISRLPQQPNLLFAPPPLP